MQRPLFHYRLTSSVLLWAVPLTLFSAVMVLWNALPQLRVLWANTLGTPLVTCGCENLFSASVHPTLTAGLLLSSTIALAVLVRFVWFFLQQQIQTRRFVNALPTVTHRIVHLRDHDLSVQVVRHVDPLLFTVGVFRPRMIVSLAQLRILNAVELRAALTHEQMHVRFGHVWKRSVLHAFIRTFAVVPALRTLLDTVNIGQELQADEATLTIVARHDVLSALTQCFTRRSGTAAPQPMPWFAAADARLQYLLSLPLPAPLLRTLIWTVGGIAALMLSSLFVSKGLFLSAAAQTDDGQHVTACMQEYEVMVESPAQSIATAVPLACIPELPRTILMPTQHPLDRIFFINYTP